MSTDDRRTIDERRKYLRVMKKQYRHQIIERCDTIVSHLRVGSVLCNDQLIHHLRQVLFHQLILLAVDLSPGIAPVQYLSGAQVLIEGRC